MKIVFYNNFSFFALKNNLCIPLICKQQQPKIRPVSLATASKSARARFSALRRRENFLRTFTTLSRLINWLTMARMMIKLAERRRISNWTNSRNKSKPLMLKFLKSGSPLRIPSEMYHDSTHWNHFTLVKIDCH